MSRSIVLESYWVPTLAEWTKSTQLRESITNGHDWNSSHSFLVGHLDTRHMDTREAILCGTRLRTRQGLSHELDRTVYCTRPHEKGTVSVPSTPVAGLWEGLEGLERQR